MNSKGGYLYRSFWGFLGFGLRCPDTHTRSCLPEVESTGSHTPGGHLACTGSSQRLSNSTVVFYKRHCLVYTADSHTAFKSHVA